MFWKDDTYVSEWVRGWAKLDYGAPRYLETKNDLGSLASWYVLSYSQLFLGWIYLINQVCKYLRDL